MFAANSTFEVGELVRFEARGFENRRRVMRTFRPALRWIVDVPIEFFTSYVARRVDAVAQDLMRRAVWFQGISVQVSKRNTSRPLDPDFKLVRLLDDTARHAASLQEHTERLVASMKGRPAASFKLTHSFQRVGIASGKLHEEILAFRAVVLQHEERVRRLDSSDAARIYFTENDPAFARLMDARKRMSSMVGSMRSGGNIGIDAELLEEARSAIEHPGH